MSPKKSRNKKTLSSRSWEIDVVTANDYAASVATQMPLRLVAMNKKGPRKYKKSPTTLLKRMEKLSIQLVHCKPLHKSL